MPGLHFGQQGQHTWGWATRGDKAFYSSAALSVRRHQRETRKLSLPCATPPRIHCSHPRCANPHLRGASDGHARRTIWLPNFACSTHSLGSTTDCRPPPTAHHASHPRSSSQSINLLSLSSASSSTQQQIALNAIYSFIIQL